MPAVVAQPWHTVAQGGASVFLKLPGLRGPQERIPQHSFPFHRIFLSSARREKMPRCLLNYHVSHYFLWHYFSLHRQGEITPAGLKYSFVGSLLKWWVLGLRNFSDWVKLSTLLSAFVWLPVVSLRFRWLTEVCQLPCLRSHKLPVFFNFPSCLYLFLADRLSHITCWQTNSHVSFAQGLFLQVIMGCCSESVSHTAASQPAIQGWTNMNNCKTIT